jgi:hypothetical protein
MVSVERIEAALLKVAAMLDRDPAVEPVFLRLEAELAKAQEAESGATETQRRARALLAQRARPAISLATCASDAPLP